MPKITTYIDKITLGSTNALIIGHKPNNLTLDQVARKLEQEKHDVAKFGFFDTAAPNFHTYYPDVKAEDLKPEADTFIRPTFRALSEVIVHKRFNPVDFSKKGVLKASMSLLMAHTVNIDHESSLGNVIGSIAGVSFQNSYTVDGLKIPAGINTELLIDGKSHPNIARKIMMEPPAIHSASVTLRFKWEPSHEFENINEFFSKIGTFGKDGILIRRIVTEILGYTEISLVNHGADPFAKLLNAEGKIVNPHIAGSMESLSAQGKAEPQHYYFNYKTDIISNAADVDDTSNSNNNNNPTSTENKIKMKEYLLKLAKQLNIKNYEDLDEAALKIAVDAALDAYVVKANSVDGKDTEITDLQTELQTEKDSFKELKAKTKDLNIENLNDSDLSSLGDNTLEEVVANAAVGTEAMELQLAECVKLYKKLKGDKADDTIIEGFKKASFAMLTSYINDYADQLNEKFPGKCNDCQSTNIARNSSITPAPGGDTNDGDNQEATPMSDADVVEEFNAPSSGGADNLHGVIEKKD